MGRIAVLSDHRPASQRLETGEVVQALRELGGVAHVSLIAQRILARRPHLGETDRAALRDQVSARLATLERAGASGVSRVFGEGSNRWSLAPEPAAPAAARRRSR